MQNQGKKYLRLNDIRAYTEAFHLTNEVWNIVQMWPYFARITIGKQFVNAVDSVSANIAEGFGRYTKKDKIHFYRYSFGSVMECLDWNEKAKRRNLLKSNEYERIHKTLQALPKEIHQLINFTNEKLRQ
mgnify:CR=1 FL=1